MKYTQKEKEILTKIQTKLKKHNITRTINEINNELEEIANYFNILDTDEIIKTYIQITINKGV